ncbi:MAG: lipoprotein LpqH [Mycobacterium sp.]
MPNLIVAIAAAALLVAGVAACSSEKQPNHPSQASVVINGNTVANQKSVICKQQQWYWTILIGDQDVSGVKAMVNKTDDTLTAQSVHIVNLGSFTGMYSKGDGGEASASFNSATFTITGTANGYNTYKPNEPATAKFKIVATC